MVCASHLFDQAVAAGPLTEAERTFDCDWSRSQGEELADVVLAGPRSRPDTAHALVLEELRHYLYVGGMPAAASAHAGGLSLQTALARQDALRRSYRDDFGKYARRADKRCLDEVLVYDTIHAAFDLLEKAALLQRLSGMLADAEYGKSNLLAMRSTAGCGRRRAARPRSTTLSPPADGPSPSR